MPVTGQLQGRGSTSCRVGRLQHRGPVHTAPPGWESRLDPSQKMPRGVGEVAVWWGVTELHASREGRGQLPAGQSRAQ